MLRATIFCLCIVCLWSAPVPCNTNCSTTTAATGTVEDKFTVDEGRHRTSHSNLAWLVTPALFALGVMYVIYKCCRDGICNCKRLRRRAAAMGETSSASDHGYIPLSQVAMYSSSQIPVPHPGVTGVNTTRRLLLVHNRTYCVTVDTVPDARGAASRRILVQPVKPPTYEEALAQYGRSDDASLPCYPPEYTSAGPPCYSIAMGEITPTPPLEDHLALESVLNALENETSALPVAFTSNRRRHRSAQDVHVKRERHRHLSAQERRLWSRSEDNDNGEFRQRCFSFSALKDAFRRSSSDVHEREALLLNENQDENVFPPHDLVNPPGATALSFLPTSERAKTHARTVKWTPQQVSFEDRILEDSESSDSMEIQSHTRDTAIGAQLRQRHSSAPETIKSQQHRSRHSSGNA